MVTIGGVSGRLSVWLGKLQAESVGESPCRSRAGGEAMEYVSVVILNRIAGPCGSRVCRAVSAPARSVP